MSKIRLWHVLVVAGLMILGTLVGVFFLYDHLMRPEAAPPELAQREVPEARTTHTESELQPSGLLRIAGAVVTTYDEPIVAVIEAKSLVSEEEIQVETGPDGLFELEIEGPAELELDELASTPEQVTVHASREDLRFVVAARCPLEVRVLAPDGEPAVGAEVDVGLRTEQGYDRVPEQLTDAQGLARFERTACGVATVSATLDDYPEAEKSEVDTVVDQSVTLQLVDGVPVSGFVLDLEEFPIEGALVRGGGGFASSDVEGFYEMRVDPTELHWLTASAEGFQDEKLMTRLPPDAESFEQDFFLAPDRRVQVYCAGMPEDSCEEVGLVMCTHPLLPFGEPCSREEPVECKCGQGEQAIRGGGESTLVGPEEDIAWLDFREHSGSVIGRVLSEGEALAKATVTCTWIPKDQQDLLEGMVALRLQDTNEDGRFAFHGLKKGTWVLELRSGSLVRSLPPVVVEGGVEDLGDIELSGGGRIEGVVLDGLTGQGKPDVAVSAVEKVTTDDPSFTPKIGNAISGTEGRFMILGLEDATYEVFIATDPFDRTEVSVSDGEADEVELVSGSSDLLDKHGFDLVTEDGDLVVDAVDGGGTAESAGLQAGDTIDSVRVFGVDLGEMLPGMEDELTDAILSTYGGPGVTLVVDREGQTVEVGL